MQSSKTENEMLEFLGYPLHPEDEDLDLSSISPSLLHSDDPSLPNGPPGLAEANLLTLPGGNVIMLDAPSEQNQVATVLLPQIGPPGRVDFPGEHKFEVLVSAQHTNQKKYLYSVKLNRIYVDIEMDFPVQFMWDAATAPWPLFIRATVVFSDESQAEKRVERCLQHRHSGKNGLEDPVLGRHVLRSSRECVNTEGVHYVGIDSRPDSWLSVLVEVAAGGAGAAGGACYSHVYQFVCKNSCVGGINRRAIHIVFSLEDVSGRVLGRQSVGARVCACPRRDLLKDEEAVREPAVPKRPLPRTEGKCKKIKLEVRDNGDDDDDLVTLPAGIQVVGAKTLTTGLTVMKNMMEQMASCKKNQPEAQEKIQRAINSINFVLSQYTS